MVDREAIQERRRALSPDARLLSRLTAERILVLERALGRAREEETALRVGAAHAAALALKTVEIVDLEEEIGRAQIALSYRNPDS